MSRAFCKTCPQKANCYYTMNGLSCKEKDAFILCQGGFSVENQEAACYYSITNVYTGGIYMGRIAPNGTPVVVQTGASVIVVNSAGEILMQQRQDDGTWSYPRAAGLKLTKPWKTPPGGRSWKSLAFL